MPKPTFTPQELATYVAVLRSAAEAMIGATNEGLFPRGPRFGYRIFPQEEYACLTLEPSGVELLSTHASGDTQFLRPFLAFLEACEPAKLIALANMLEQG